MRWRVWCGCVLAWVGAATVAEAALQPSWQGEAETCFQTNRLAEGAAFVDDATASGGRALKLPGQPGSPQIQNYNAMLHLPAQRLQGRCVFTLYVRGEGLLPMSHGLRVWAIAHDKKTMQWSSANDFMIYGSRLQPTGYTPVRCVVDTGWKADDYPIAMLFKWDAQPEGAGVPVLLIDRIEIESEILDHPLIGEILPGKPRFSPGKKATALVTLINPTDRDFAMTLQGEDRSGLDGRRAAFAQRIRLKAGEAQEVACSWNHGGRLYGHEIVVKLLVDGRVVDTASELYGVHPVPMWLSTGNTYDSVRHPKNQHSFFYVDAGTVQQTREAVHFWRKLNPGGEYWEFFSWAPGDMSDLAPTEDPFPGGEGRLTYRSRELLLQQIAMLKDAGIWPLTYVNGTCWAESGYQLFARHPEWFLFDANGEVAHYEMDRRELYRRKDDLDFNPAAYPSIFFQASLNTARPDVQEFVARQYIRAAKEMGFRGVRMDVRYLEVSVGERDFDLQEVCPDWATADRVSAANVRRVKELVHREVPDFTFGYNYCSPEETVNLRGCFKERCAGGGWMLDEVSCGYQEKISPYHVWSAYVPRMVSWGDQVTRWGGIYNPFDFRRGATPYAVDRVYSSLFRLIGAGRIPLYYNSSYPYGDWGRFSTRFSEFFFGNDRHWIPEVRDEADVRAAAPVWWRDMVFWNRNQEGRRQLIVNLVNPPKAAEVEENPLSEMNPPVRDLSLSCAPVDGRPPRSAWLLSAEAMEPGEVPGLQAIQLPLKTDAQGRTVVTVPCVLLWKMVVFEF